MNMFTPAARAMSTPPFPTPEALFAKCGSNLRRARLAEPDTFSL